MSYGQKRQYNILISKYWIIRKTNYILKTVGNIDGVATVIGNTDSVVPGLNPASLTLNNYEDRPKNIY